MWMKLMEEVIRISIWASLIVIIIQTIKYLFGIKIGAKNQSYLWRVFLLRLIFIIPIKIPTNIKNMLTIKEFNNIITKNKLSYKAQDIINWFQIKSEESFTIGTSIDVLNIVLFLIFIFWISYILSSFAYRIFKRFELNFKIETSSQKPSIDVMNSVVWAKKQMLIHKEIPVIMSSNIESPIVYGFFKTKIGLPQNLEEILTITELRYVILHELAHIKRRDLWTFEVLAILKTMYFFNPIVIYGIHKLKEDIEMTCDASAIEIYGCKYKKYYGLSLLKWLTYQMQKQSQFSVANYASSKKELKRRMKMLGNYNKKHKNKNIAKILVIGIIGLVMLGEVQAQGSLLGNSNEVQSTSTELKGNEGFENVLDESNLESSLVNDLKIDFLETEEQVAVNWIWPLKGYNKITSHYGEFINPVTKETIFHTGLDIGARNGKNILASRAGIVILAEFNEDYGKFIIIDHGDGYATLYGHASELLVEKDSEVKAGDIIAKVGTTGSSTGPHLHFEVRKDSETVDPMNFFKENTK